MEIPSHVAIIMDGNGRWALEKDLPRRRGHIEGVKALKRVTHKAGVMGISCLTVYAFSTENWKRPGREVNFLMNLFQETLMKQAQELFENNVKVRVIGSRDGLSTALLKTIKEIEDMTVANQGLQLNIAFNYGGRAEIIDMFKKMKKDNMNNKLDIDNIEEKDLNKYLYNPSYPEVELLIRTGGEKRLSNFMLWELAYAELYFTSKYWPDFNERDMEEAIKSFQNRDRKFGGLKKDGVPDVK